MSHFFIYKTQGSVSIITPLWPRFFGDDNGVAA